MPVLQNIKNEHFAQMVAAGIRPLKAYEDCGHVPDGQMASHQQVNSLRNSAKVKARISELLNMRALKMDVTPHRVLAEMAKIGFASMSTYLHIDEHGQPEVDLSACTPDEMAAIQEVTIEEYMEGRGADAREVRRIKFKLHDKRAALVDIAKVLGMHIEQHQISGPGGGPVAAIIDVSRMTPEQLRVISSISIPDEDADAVPQLEDHSGG